MTYSTPFQRGTETIGVSGAHLAPQDKYTDPRRGDGGCRRGDRRTDSENHQDGIPGVYRAVYSSQAQYSHGLRQVTYYKG